MRGGPGAVGTRRSHLPSKTLSVDGTVSAVSSGSSTAGPAGSPGAEPALVALNNSAGRTLSLEDDEMGSSAVESTLETASRRGVDVEVTMTADSRWDAAFTALTGAGVRVATYPDSSSALSIHAKAIVADGATALVGSQNLSNSSLGYNRELGVITSDPAVVGPVSHTLAADVAGATGRGSSTAPVTSPPAGAPGPSSTTTTGACRLAPEGNCYRAAEYCPDAMRGQIIEGGDGRIACVDDNHWRWKPAG
jgi:hypothetical protein